MCEDLVKMLVKTKTQEVGSQKRKEQIQMWTEYEPWFAQIQD
jgi:hypothetical protein